MDKVVQDADNPAKWQHVDVLIVGAGISGLGAAYELKDQCPEYSFLVLEGMESFGGTWHWHKYPGVRSDSDLFTFGYRFKPWRGDPIASGQQILEYLKEVIDENDLEKHIRYNHKIAEASWSSQEKLWTLTVTENSTGEVKYFTCNFLWMCQGYYRHSEGYTPKWPGMNEYQGELVHPQTWPEDLDYSDKKITIIGSGATAATLVPALAKKSEHVTMLQRSPTYFSPGANKNRLADMLRELDVDEKWIHEIVRRRVVLEQRKYLNKTIENPEKTKKEQLAALREYLPQEVIDEHFTPEYRPWQQRIAMVPDGDLFKCVANGKASVVTDKIERFTEEGLLLSSGKELKSDIVVTATGFNLSALGDINFIVDGDKVDFSKTVTYRGMMFTGIPNMVWIMGYWRAASWTLRVDMVSDFVCRLLKMMEEQGRDKVEVALRPEEKDMELSPWIDAEDFNPGYMLRNEHLWPRRGTTKEWAHSQDYWWERDVFPNIDLNETPFLYDDETSQ